MSDAGGTLVAFLETALLAAYAPIPVASLRSIGIGVFLTCAALAGASAETTDPSQGHRWHMPRRGARDLPRDAVGPVHAEWNRLGHLVDAGKEALHDPGITFDVDLDFFEQHASHVASGQNNFGTFSWRIMGDWRLFDLSDHEGLSGVGKGYLAWTTFGTEGLDYDKNDESPTANVGTTNVLNATIFEQGAVVDGLYWKQVALGGKLLVLAGKIDLLYHFDTNRVANDGYSQFFSYSLQNNPSIPGPLYGGFGGVVRGNPTDNTYLMVAGGDSSMDAAVLPWKTLDNDSWYQLVELGWAPDVPGLGKGNYRLTPWHNHLFGEDGFGVGINFDQELGRKDVVAFFRFGFGDKDVTPAETFVSGGVALEAPFGRQHDVLAVGVAWSDPSGEGRDETLIELLYRIEVAKAISITPDLQLVFDPADNHGDDFVAVPGVRLHLKF
jgi:carbohydrate-selective porin OprB